MQEDGWSALMIACGLPSKEDDIKTLISLGAPLTLKDNDGEVLRWVLQLGQSFTLKEGRQVNLDCPGAFNTPVVVLGEGSCG